MSNFASRAVRCASLVCSVLALGACSLAETGAPYGGPGAPGGGGYPGGGAGSPGGAPGGGGYGATPGGTQDINFARELVAAGTVPEAEAFTVEGLLSQHDLPSDGAPCEDLLCARPSLGVAPSVEHGESTYWLMLGLSSGIAEFVRPPADVSIVIDASGSMSGDMEETLEAASRLVQQLRDDDRVSVVVFRSSVEVMRPMSTLGEDRTELLAALRRIDARGGAELFAGMAEGYEQVRSVGDDAARLRRVIVLSCAPATSVSPSMLEALVAAGGEERIGLTFVGVLVSYDFALADILSRQRGGNHFYTGSLEQIEQVFDTDLDFTLTPLAYDLNFQVALAEGWEIEHVYGVPGDTAAEGRAGFEVSTAFISRRGGAIVLQLRKQSADAPQQVGDVTLGYEPESAHGWSGTYEESATLDEPRLEGESDVRWGGPGVRKAVALVQMAEQLRTASAAWHTGAQSSARTLTDTLLTHLELEAEALDDDGLRDEVEFVRAYRLLLGD